MRDTTVFPDVHPPVRPTAAALQAYGGGWQADLQVDVEAVAGRSAATRVEHRGPLRLQKVLWPEGPELAHLLLLHPPSGLAGGDTVDFRLKLGPSARALLTTPGAGRWYRADSPATQSVDLELAPGSSLEWLPQEIILHDGVLGRQSTRVRVAASADAIGMEILVLGRRASGERLEQGEFRSRLSLLRDGRLLLDERTRIAGHESGMAAMGDAHVSGLLWAVSSRPMPSDIADTVERELDSTRDAQPWREARPSSATLAGASLIDPHLLLVRAVGVSPERLRRTLMAAWMVLRPLLIGRPGILPRIWMT